MTRNRLSDLTSLELSRRGLLGLGAALGVGAAVSACGGGSAGTPGAAGKKIAEGAYDGPKVELAFWNGFTGGDGAFMKQMVENFNSENDKIKVKMNVLQWGDFYSKMPNAVASGAGPDIGAMHIDQVGTNAARGVIQPLDNMVDALKLEEGDFSEIVWKAGIYDEKRYAIPLDIHPLGFYYNKTLLSAAGIEEPPQDRESWEATLKALKESGVDQPYWATATFPGHLIFASLLEQFGGSLFDEEGTKATFNSEAGVEALTWHTDHIADGYSPPDVTKDAELTAFQQGRNALTFNGIWQILNFDKTEGLDYGVAPFPQIGSEKAVWASSHQLTVMRQAEPDDNKLHASREFLNYISEASAEWAKGGQIPARNSARESPEFAELTGQSTLAEQLDYVVFPPTIPGIGDVPAPTYELAVNTVVLGKAEPKQALDEAVKKANAILEDNVKKYTA